MLSIIIKFHSFRTSHTEKDVARSAPANILPDDTTDTASIQSSISENDDDFTKLKHLRQDQRRSR